MSLKFYVLFLTLFFVFKAYSAHGPEGNEEEKANQTVDSIKKDSFQPAYDGRTASFNDFPNLHPLIVHFPVAFFPLALFLQVLLLFWRKESISWIVFATLIFGLISSIIAAYFWHPHPENLTGKVKEVLSFHESLAKWTVYTSIVAVAGKFVSHYFFKLSTPAVVITCVLITAPAVLVSLTGHHGSQMVYLHGVGVKGKMVTGQDEKNEKQNVDY